MRSLSQFLISHTPMIAKSRRAIGTRLIITSLSENSAGVIAQELSAYLQPFHGVIFLAMYHSKFDQELIQWDPPSNVILEIPGRDLDSAAMQQLVRDLNQRGTRLAIRGRASKPLDPEFVEIFEYSIMHASEEKRIKPEVDSKILAMRKIRFIMTGIAQVSDVDLAFERGAVASAGWPMDEKPNEDVNNFRLSKTTLTKLRSLVHEHADHSAIESVMKQDPALTFKFFRYLNSGSFGKSLQISRFKQALTILGHKHLSRWLEEQMAGALVQDDNAYPLMHASLRRGLFLQRLLGTEPKERDAIFLTGAFSLLDKITQTSFNRLMSMISVTDDISNSVTTTYGPWSSALCLAVSIEQNAVEMIQKLASEMLLPLGAVNHALLMALSEAEDIESDDFEVHTATL